MNHLVGDTTGHPVAAVTGAVLAALAAALLVAGRPVVDAWLPVLVGRARSGALGSRLLPAAGGAVVVGAWWALGAAHLVLVAIAVAVVLSVGRLLAHQRSARLAEARAGCILAACDGMAADLAAGQPPRAALRRAAQEWPELTPVAVAADLDADVPAALRRLATLPGAGQLRTVAASWQVAHRSGAGLAATLARVAAVLREEQRTGRLVATELAAARATARMMAALPVLVLLLGAGIGGDPVGFLTGTPFGLGCLAAGLALTHLGLAWLERVADGVLGRG
ncbi:MAG: type II secretion system F family protein [Marmoricola sp.]